MTTVAEGLTPNSTATSNAAAVAIAPNARTLRGQVYDLLVERGQHGATDEEMQTLLNMNPSTQRPRRGELVTDGRVADSGRTRATRSGRSAVVWVAL